MFNPDRFLDEEGNFLHSKYIIAFSVGPRHCLGEQLAKMEVFTFLVGMIQKFEFHFDPTDEELASIECGTLGFTYKPFPFKMVAKEL